MFKNEDEDQFQLFTLKSWVAYGQKHIEKKNFNMVKKIGTWKNLRFKLPYIAIHQAIINYLKLTAEHHETVKTS